MLRAIRRDDLVPSEILDILHRLRIDGNAAVHGHNGERRMPLRPSSCAIVWVCGYARQRLGNPD